MSLCEKLNILNTDSKLKLDNYITDIYFNLKTLNEFIDSDQKKFKIVWKLVIEGKYYPDFVYSKMWTSILENFPFKSFVRLNVNNNLIQKTFVNMNYSNFVSDRKNCRLFIINLFSNFVLFLIYFFISYTKKLKLRIKYANKNIQRYIEKYKLVLSEIFKTINILGFIIFGKKLTKNIFFKNQIMISLKQNDFKKLILSFYEFKFFDILPNCLPILLLHTTNIIDPNFWGSLVWRTLHFCSELLRINKNELIFKKYTFFLFNNFYKYIPCGVCKNHWKVLIENNKDFINTISSESMNNLMWKFHNEVNKTKMNASLIISWEYYVSNDKIFYENLIKSLE